jgi:hypothetical protein
MSQFDVAADPIVLAAGLAHEQAAGNAQPTNFVGFE